MPVTNLSLINDFLALFFVILYHDFNKKDRNIYFVIVCELLQTSYLSLSSSIMPTLSILFSIYVRRIGETWTYSWNDDGFNENFTMQTRRNTWI